MHRAPIFLSSAHLWCRFADEQLKIMLFDEPIPALDREMVKQ